MGIVFYLGSWVSQLLMLSHLCKNPAVGSRLLLTDLFVIQIYLEIVSPSTCLGSGTLSPAVSLTFTQALLSETETVAFAIYSIN